MALEGLKELFQKYRELIMYLIFGVATTVFNWGCYALLVFFNVDINVANILSWIFSVLFAFAVNKWFVFESKSLRPLTVARELASFIGARIITGIIAIVLFPICYNLGMDQSIFGIDGFLAKIFTSAIEIILNWVFSKYLVFIKKKPAAE